MVGSVKAFDLAVVRAFVRAGTEEHVVEDPKPEAYTVDGERRHANLLVEKAAANSSRPCHVFKSPPITSGPSGSTAAA